MKYVMLAAAMFAATGACAAPPLEAFGRAPAIENVELSPSGQQFALIGRQNDTRSVVVRKADGEAVFLGTLGDAEVSDLLWAGEDHLLVFRRATVGTRNFGMPLQTWRVGINVDLKARNATVVFKDSRTVVDAIFGVFGNRYVDGRWYAYVGAVPYDKVLSKGGGIIYPDLYRVDVQTGAYQPVAKAGLGAASWALASNGSIVGRASYDARGRTQSIFLTSAGDQPRISRVADEQQLRIAGLGRTADSIMVIDRASDQVVARELRPGGPAEGEVVFTGVQAEQLLQDPNTGLVVGAARGDGSGPEFIDPERQRRLRATLRAFPNATTRLVSFTSDLNHMVVYTEGPEDPGSYWLVDIEKKSAQPIGDARPGIKPSDLGVVQVLGYRAADGTAMDGVLTLPPGRPAKGLPLVVIPSVAPQGQRASPRLDMRAQAFASRGYAVFQPNVRGSSGSGEAFRRLAEGQVGRALQTDLSDGVAALAAQGTIDPKRVCIVGESYGGYAALAGVTLQHGIYRCAVSISGFFDLPRFSLWAKDHAMGDVRHELELKWPMGPVAGEDLEQISPARQARLADAPVLLIHGMDDPTIPMEQSQMMERALKSAGKPVALVLLPKEDHTLESEKTRQSVLAQVVSFLEANNPPN